MSILDAPCLRQLGDALDDFLTCETVGQVTVGLPVFILCMVAIMVDAQAPCPGMPSLFAWIWTQTFLAVCLVIGHAALLLKIFLGKKKLAAKAQELQDKNEGKDNTRDDAVGGWIGGSPSRDVFHHVRGCGHTTNKSGEWMPFE